MDIARICPHCMQEITEGSKFCAHCGKDVSARAELRHQLPVFTILGGKYLIGDVIGEGGFGITYIGLDLDLEMRVAIKEFYPANHVSRNSAATTQVTVHSGTSEENVARWKNEFLEEAKCLVACKELPGIVDVYSFFEENNTVYFVMEYMDGMTLKDFCQGMGGKISIELLLPAMEPVVTSLLQVHNRGIIHLDISPDNIMRLNDGTMKVFDFGASRRIGQPSEKELVLKNGYAPEEQYSKSGDLGPWTDVYALCATFYKCITGEKPIESIERLRKDELMPPSAYGIRMNPAIESTIMAGLAVNAKNRIQNMNALHAALYTAYSPMMEQTMPLGQGMTMPILNNGYGQADSVTMPGVGQIQNGMSKPMWQNGAEDSVTVPLLNNGQTVAAMTQMGQTMPGQVMSGQVMSGQTMPGQVIPGQTLPGQRPLWQNGAEDSVTIPLTAAQAQAMGTASQGPAFAGAGYGQIPGNQMQNGQMPGNNMYAGQPPKKSKAPLIIGLVGGGIALVAIILVLVLVVFKKDDDVIIAPTDEITNGTAGDTTQTAETGTTIVTPPTPGTTEGTGNSEALEKTRGDFVAATNWAEQANALPNYYEFLDTYGCDDTSMAQIQADYSDYIDNLVDFCDTMMKGDDTRPNGFAEIYADLSEAQGIKDELEARGVDLSEFDIENGLDSYREEFTDILVELYDRTAENAIQNNGQVSRGELWAIMEGADESHLYEEEDICNPIHTRYASALAFHIDSEVGKKSGPDAVAYLYDNMEACEYSPLAMFYLALAFDDAQGHDMYDNVCEILLEDEGVDFNSLDDQSRKNFIYYFSHEEYNETRERIYYEFRDRYPNPYN